MRNEGGNGQNLSSGITAGTYRGAGITGHCGHFGQAGGPGQKAALADLLCFSHLRWNFVYQRPQHLMVRWGRERRVFFIEEPVLQGKCEKGHPLCGSLLLRPKAGGVVVATPQLPAGLSPLDNVAAQRRLLDRLITGYQIQDYLLWYYTAMALPFTSHLVPHSVIYDCIDEEDEICRFNDGPRELGHYEAELLARADVVMTGGYSLYESKRELHRNVHLFPSSVDQAHFMRARQRPPEPKDQADLLHPRLGFFGVIDERMDTALLDALAQARPDWHIVLVGPLVKSAAAGVPRRRNIHYLGMKAYEELPAYLSGWDVALLPFAHNASTRFISPTQIPEYLAAGKKVVSTRIRDVVNPYGNAGLVRIADSAPDFVTAVEEALQKDSAALLPRIDAMLAQTCWDLTWRQMKQVVDGAVRPRPPWATRKVDGCLTM